MIQEPTQNLIGKLLDGVAQRDAIHIAVAPVISAGTYEPGTDIGLLGDGRAGLTEKPIGIVDPFLKRPVKAGERFFMFLYPNTITGLRHQWTHEDFDGDLAASEKWLRDFAEANCSGYDDERTPDQCYAELLKMAEQGDFCFSGQPDELYSPTGQMEIWHHVERIRGAPFSPVHKEKAEFRCSC